MEGWTTDYCCLRFSPLAQSLVQFLLFWRICVRYFGILGQSSLLGLTVFEPVPLGFDPQRDAQRISVQVDCLLRGVIRRAVKGAGICASGTRANVLAGGFRRGVFGG